jgi:hypothetical protein
MTSWAGQRYGRRSETQAQADSAQSAAESTAAAALASHEADADAHHTAGWKLYEAGFTAATATNVSEYIFGSGGTLPAAAMWRLTLYVNLVTTDDRLTLVLNGDTGTNYYARQYNSLTVAPISPVFKNNEHALIEVLIAKPTDTEEALIMSRFVGMVNPNILMDTTFALSWRNTSALVNQIRIGTATGGSYLGSNTHFVLEYSDAGGTR